jgi:hypothetical protein
VVVILRVRVSRGRGDQDQGRRSNHLILAPCLATPGSTWKVLAGELGIRLKRHEVSLVYSRPALTRDALLCRASAEE